MNRADASDVAWDAATGITSGTHRPNPSVEVVEGDPQADIAIPSGPVTPLTPYDFAFQVADNPANRTMRVTINTDLIGDCTLQLLSGPAGEERPETEVVDAGFVTAEETAIVTNPKPGRWVARIGDFAACGVASGTISFEGQGAFDATGTADTWSNDTQAPTGWAFTNIRTGGAEGLSHGTDAGGPGTLTVDILNLAGATDLSPGFARPATTAGSGAVPVVTGKDNPFSVLVFNNGSTAATDVGVQVRRGSPSGPVVAAGQVSVPAYSSAPFSFTFDPGEEGGYDLFTVVDPAGAVNEAVEDNNVQKVSGWAGPADPSVLIVDDDGAGDTERVYAGALAALGIPYAIAERHVTADQLAGYDAVIWVSTLDRNEGQIDEDDRAAIAAHLGDGGKLWMSSNRAIEALTAGEQAEFVAQWFGVEWIDIDSFYKPVQMLTDDILGDDDLSIEVLPGRPFVDKYKLAANPGGDVTSLGVLDGSGTPDDGEAVLGARLEGDADGTAFQTVVNGFSLSQVSEPADAIAMVGAIMDHFGVARNQYEVASDEPIVYHSQLRQTVSDVALPVRAIVLGGDAGQPVTLHYRHHGIGDYTALAMEPNGNAGGYFTSFPPHDVGPDGIDYYLKAGTSSTYEPRLAANGSVAHAVAVFLPEAIAPAPLPDPGPVPAPAPPGGGRLPATGGEAVVGAAVLLLLAGLALRRLHAATHD
jgi:hypothetical protein